MKVLFGLFQVWLRAQARAAVSPLAILNLIFCRYNMVRLIELLRVLICHAKGAYSADILKETVVFVIDLVHDR